MRPAEETAQLVPGGQARVLVRQGPYEHAAEAMAAGRQHGLALAAHEQEVGTGRQAAPPRGFDMRQRLVLEAGCGLVRSQQP